MSVSALEKVSESTKPDKTPKEMELSEKTTAWCRKVAGIAAKRAFRVKALQSHRDTFSVESVRFFFLPKIFHRKRISHTDGNNQIYLHPEFFDEKGNIRKKLPRKLREELKAAIYKEVSHFAFKRANSDFYKVMVRCPWAGTRVDGAPGSSTAARDMLSKRKQKKVSRKRSIEEVATGLTEDVKMWDLTTGKHVLVKNAEIFLADGKIKIARGIHNNKKLRTMLPGGAELKTRLGL
jgi:hypothetical protein